MNVILITWNLLSTDVTLMDDVNWASYAIPMLEDMCEESAIRKRMNWQKDQFGNWVLPQEVIDALNCPNSCSGNGVCLEFGCVCNPGFSSNDCSVLEGGQTLVSLFWNTHLLGSNSVYLLFKVISSQCFHF